MIAINVKIIRGFLMLSYVVVIAICLFLISAVYTYFNTGADRSKLLQSEVIKIDKYLPTMTWANNGNKGRAIDSQTILDLKNDYLDAWYLKNIALRVNQKEGLKDYFTETAIKNLFTVIEHNKANNISIVTTTLKHNPDVLFFSEDGQLIVLEDKNVTEYKKIIQDNNTILETTEVNTYKIVFLLEDGYWRIRHFIKQETAPFNTTVKTDLIDYKNIRGINYYPQENAWDMYNDKFDIEVIKKDFKIITNANLNTIRIFVPYIDFGKAKVKESKLDKLKQVLDAAEKQNIKVVVTLFDLYGNYDVLDWTLNQTHARTIVNTFKDHKAIIAWDVKNEPNLDFDSRGKQNVLSWLEYMIVLIKSIDTKHAVTIGWSNIESAELLKDKVDFISFHYYDDLNDLEEKYKNLQSKVNKNIVLGEYGVSSYNGFWKPFGGSEKKQAAYFKQVQQIINNNNIPFLSWTLYDFKTIPKEVVGNLPWRYKPQKEYGFINIKGEKKLSFKYISK